MLDSLFKFVGFKRLEVNFTVEEESASDEEYICNRSDVKFNSVVRSRVYATQNCA